MLETLKNILRQSAGNHFLSKRVGSSETIRRNFSVKKSMKNIMFSNYLAGIIEGDGTIIVPTRERSNTFKKISASVQICFHLKDLPLALVIQERLGFGSLNRIKGKNAYNYTINSLQGIETVCGLLNGFMRTPKIYDLWKLIDWLNNEKPHLLMVKKEKNNAPLLEDGWLSGFIEADGHFAVRTTLSQFKIECKFELVQSVVDHNHRKNYDKLPFLKKIGESIYSPVKYIRANKPRKEYRVRTVNLRGNMELERYLWLFPLFGAKFLDFKDWCIVLDLFKKKVNKKRDFYEQTVCIKKRMNQNRKVFQWDHLKGFYHLEK